MKSRRTSTLAKAALAIALGALLLAALVISSSHSLHSAWHGENSAADHACLACTLSAGAFLGAIGAVLAASRGKSFFEPACAVLIPPRRRVEQQSARGPPLV